MGYFCSKIHITCLLNLLHQLIFYASALVYAKQPRKHNTPEEDVHRPSPSLVPLPFTITSHVLVTKKLPVIEFGEFLDKHSRIPSQGDFESHECAICLNRVEMKQEIRELSNCAHVYHRECLEGWLDKGRETCPLCRLRVLPTPTPTPTPHLAVNHDPWRLERMAYLFGEDCLFQSL